MALKRKKTREQNLPVANETGIRKAPNMKKRSAFQMKMLDRLNAGKFRMLNESMYTTTGAQAKAMMQKNPDLFRIYHDGYARQVQKWPANPLDVIIRFLKRQKKGLNVADLGCGEARLAKELPQHDVKSFDLVAANDRVIECDIANVPLSSGSVQVVVFCLSLMGTNYADFLIEARRILVPNGLLLIAEVASRFESHDPSEFAEGVKALGFRQEKDHPVVREAISPVDNNSKRRKKSKKKKTQDPSHETQSEETKAFFVRFAFKKVQIGKAQEPSNESKALPPLLSCQYKKR